jgi:N-acetylglucosamine-6-phosphate deacetylase
MTTHEITGRDPASGHPIRLIIESGVIVGREQTTGDTDLYLSPGFVDLQVNGYAGFDVNAEEFSTSTVVSLVSAMLEHGVTCFQPTLITAAENKICRSLKIISEARRESKRVAACIPRVHIEGPRISPLDGYRGAHAVEDVRPASVEEFDRWQDAAEGTIGMVTLSPHFDDSAEYIAALVKRGVHVAIGHTHAAPEQITAAVDAGARLSTHLGNGIAAEIPRHRNPLFSQLAEDRLAATFIADGHHLPADVLKILLRAKGMARSILVSDSVALAGMPPGTYNTFVGGEVELRPDGKLCMPGTEFLAGSTASLVQCIGHVIRAANISLGDAIAMATVNPGQFVGNRGQLALGSRADVVSFRWKDQVVIENVWLAGEPLRD